jgi:ferritin-like metal-binding protein YciE
MAEKSLKDLLLHTLKDVYFAEHEILKALPKMAQAAQRAELKEAFETHREQTEQQVQRLKDVFALLDQQAQGEPCKAIQGIIAEGQDAARERGLGTPHSPAFESGKPPPWQLNLAEAHAWR